MLEKFNVIDISSRNKRVRKMFSHCLDEMKISFFFLLYICRQNFFFKGFYLLNWEKFFVFLFPSTILHNYRKCFHRFLHGLLASDSVKML